MVLIVDEAESESEVSKKTEEIKIVVESNWKFLVKIYHALAKANGEQSNLALSSFSISSVLALALTGAKGATHDQMQEVLCLPKDEPIWMNKFEIMNGYKQIFTILKGGDENFTMKMANQIFVHNKFNLLDSYLEHAAKYFLVKPEFIDFERSSKVCGNINSWVNKNTNHKVKKIVSAEDIRPFTRAVLVNAVYLKMKWEQPFIKSQTKHIKFYLTPRSSVDAPLMHVTAEFKVCTFDELSCDALLMPCRGNKFSMIFFLSETHGDFHLMESNLSLANLEILDRTPKTTYEVTIPKFQLEATHDLNEHLKSLGMTDMFDEKKADFSGMVSEEDLCISKVVQKVFIKVTEDGCEESVSLACANPCAGIGAKPRSASASRPVYISHKFTCNRPFLFIIRENATGIILFSGRVMNPKPTGNITEADYNTVLEEIEAERPMISPIAQGDDSGEESD